MFNLSSAMGGQFAIHAAELTEEIKKIGVNPLKDIGKDDQSEETEVAETDPNPIRD